MKNLLNIETLVNSLNLPWVTQVWMEGNLLWLLHVVILFTIFLSFFFSALVIKSGLVFVLALIVFIRLLYVFSFTGLKKGFLISPVFKLPGDQKEIALTFDDGPHGEHTPRILDILAENDIKGTFFVVGKHIELYPEIAQRICEDGHDLGNHGYSHTKMKSLCSYKRLAEEYDRAKGLIEKIKPDQKQIFRPPHGEKSMLLEWLVKKREAVMVNWNVSPKDWKPIEPELLLKRLVDYSHPGSVVLLHDSMNAVKILPEYIKIMQANGFAFVPITKNQRGIYRCP
ncbi:MAG: polysaccharide deacetylase family protein [Thermodesulfobacteriota bacterium]|nr:polysaccharide deacetylase family protein [Thermodesulfobacteriota bacterium]